jgi:hypothetical protein
MQLSKYLIDAITNENVIASWPEKSRKTLNSPELRHAAGLTYSLISNHTRYDLQTSR